MRCNRNYVEILNFAFALPLIIKVDEAIRLESLQDKHSEALFNLVTDNKSYLRQWMPWVDNDQLAAFIKDYARISAARSRSGNEYAFVIIADEKIAGRIGVYNIDEINKIGEIGYWVGRHLQGKGIVTKCCEKLISFCFDDINLNRIEIICGIENYKSQKIPERLLFTKEGIMRQAKLVQNDFIDLILYSLLKKDRR